MSSRALTIASLVGTLLQVLMVVTGHSIPAIAALFAVGGMGLSLLAGVIYARLARPATKGAAAIGGGAAGAVCAFLGILVSYLLGDVPATLLALGTLSSALTGAIGGFLIALLTIFKPSLAPWTAPIYAVLEGIALGGISAVYSARYAGLPGQAVTLTFAVFVVMLVLYGTGLVRATPLFRRVIATAAMALMGFYLLTFIVSFFGVQMPLVNSATPMGIAFSVVACLIASFFLILDFDLISEGIQRQAPKRMEWYGAFTLLVSLVWIYLEMLRLLGKLRR
jgi:uncharacterized YccA/Bax inhibitor family protein